jgi:hypothetical protein
MTDCNKTPDDAPSWRTRTSRLHDIALSVEEQEPGRFYWVLMESSGDDIWSELASSANPESSWKDAFHAGCLALGNLVPRGIICFHHGRFAA